MTFSEAMKIIIDNGGKARRKIWKKALYVEKQTSLTEPVIAVTTKKRERRAIRSTSKRHAGKRLGEGRIMTNTPEYQQAHEAAVEAMAISLSGAPFPSPRSKKKAYIAAGYYLTAMAERGFTMQPTRVMSAYEKEIRERLRNDESSEDGFDPMTYERTTTTGGAMQPVEPAMGAFWKAKRIADAAKKLNATPATTPGLWNAPGYPELTTAQLLQIAGETDE